MNLQMYNLKSAWGPKIIQFGALQNKSSAAYLLKIASEDTPVGKLLTCKTYVLVNIKLVNFKCLQFENLHVCHI